MSTLIHPKTDQQLQHFTNKPSHAVVLVGPAGSGKLTLAQQLAEMILELKPNSLPKYAYQLMIRAEDGKAIGIEAIRALDHFFAQQVPGTAAHNRVVIIEDSHLMTTEAQNALLKLLEEPPAGSVLILTASHAQALLPTLRSRTQQIDVLAPAGEQLADFFKGQGFAEETIQQAEVMSGGLPGLMTALLTDAEHPLRLATETARELLGKAPYERLLLVDELAKQKGLVTDTLFILQQMAHVRLQTAEGTAAKRWQQVLEASYHATEALHKSGQPKLVLIELMLAL